MHALLDCSVSHGLAASQRGVERSYADLTGAPDESSSRRRENGLAKAGNARVRRGMLQLAWRWLMFQMGSALAMVETESSCRALK
jgi:transposase